MVKCSKIIEHMEKLCPKKLAMDWDNVGLLVGNKEQEINNVMVALDITNEVLKEAVKNKADMIVTHHPVIFKPIKSVTTDTTAGNLVYNLIRNNISVYSAHTNLDIAQGGINDVLAEMFGLEDIKPLEISSYEKLKKIVVFVPETHAEIVREAMASAGAGWIGNYSDCSFAAEGIGAFKPLEGTKPFIGSLSSLEKVKEVRIETIAKESQQNHVISEMKKVHPYEEVAFDIYPVDNRINENGIGRAGLLKNELALKEMADLVKDKLNLKEVRVIGNTNGKIRKVAICSGSGMDMVKLAKQSKADVYITGDSKYHEAQEALHQGLNIIDAGHYGTENIIVPVLKRYVEEIDGIKVFESKVNADPYTII